MNKDIFIKKTNTIISNHFKSNIQVLKVSTQFSEMLLRDIENNTHLNNKQLVKRIGSRIYLELGPIIGDLDSANILAKSIVE